ncbi:MULTISPECIES: hypothetical protein [Variovorax]|uniref:hypothetical protein n=1 Tax=Variovorax TaxID=34072 RepID=UPI001AD252C4|nr:MULTISPECIES: hypothetical protein [Variovorax]MBN8758756.1 hypothetical protein [Variovorax sp.]UKI08950.1 hypothetical protein L3V85_03590 [Variovorax paradoxus]
MKSRTIYTVIAVFLVVSVVATFIGRWAGESMAKEVKARLSLLWPDVMGLPEQDRALLALLAYECRLQDQPEGRSATITCLRSATNADRVKKVSADPAAHLDKLLDQARGRAS